MSAKPPWNCPRPPGPTRQFANTVAGRADLVVGLSPWPALVDRAVHEPAGGYERPLVAALAWA